MRVLTHKPCSLQQDGVKELGTRDIFWASRGSSSLSAFCGPCFFSPCEGPAGGCCGPSDAQSRVPVGRTWGEPCHTWLLPLLPLPSPASPHPYRILPGPKAVPELVITFCFFDIEVPSAQAGNDCGMVGKDMEREPQKWLSTAGREIKIALLAHGYKKVYMLHFEGENCLHYSQVSQCLQLCLDTSDSQGNCFEAFCGAPPAEPGSSCAQAPALHTTALSVLTGPGEAGITASKVSNLPLLLLCFPRCF